MTWDEAEAIAATAVMRILPRLIEPQARAAVREAFTDIRIELVQRGILDGASAVGSAYIPIVPSRLLNEETRAAIEAMRKVIRQP